MEEEGEGPLEASKKPSNYWEKSEGRRSIVDIKAPTLLKAKKKKKKVKKARG